MVQRLRLPLPAAAIAPRLARQAVAQLLAALGRNELIPNAVLLVSELVTNAVVHARGPIVLRATYHDSTLRVEVHDTLPAPPSQQQSSTLDETGRGLQLVALIAQRWATAAEPQGKSVWFELS